ncbi:hypothetical protein F4802DRAFT_486113 [Xylaria palmicola]|nr:hypothetical protein F4802DRAFT_486113 [Xylaria palmicola]
MLNPSEIWWRSPSHSAENTTEQQSTVGRDKKEKADEIKKVSLKEGLRTRRVEFSKPVKDPKAAKFKSFIVSRAKAIGLEQTKSLRDKVELFLSKADEFQTGASIYDAVEVLSDAINEWKSTVRMPTVTNRDFNKDLERCRYAANEAVFQRTIMMSILNRHQLSDKFDFNCEGRWLLENSHYPLESTENNQNLAPQPDLAIFFRFDSLVGQGPSYASTPIPEHLKMCMSPDGSYLRCFPFIFIETQEGSFDLGPALMANMHTASQVLLNIYVWMSEARYQYSFFSDVRVFSIAINSKEFVLRVHRAQAAWAQAAHLGQGDHKGLEFYYDNICDKYRYKRDHICNLIQNILSGYAETTLLDILKRSVLAVSGDQRQMQSLKRNCEVAGLAAGDPASKRPTGEPLN